MQNSEMEVRVVDRVRESPALYRVSPNRMNDIHFFTNALLEKCATSQAA